MCGRLRHVPAVAGRAHAPPLAREGDDELLRAPCADRAGESEAEQPGREILADLLFDVARDGLLAGRVIREPALEALRNDLVLVIDPTGRVLDRRELRPCPPSATGDLVVVPLPDGPVTAGAEWTIPQEVVVEAPGAGRKAVKTRLRYRLEALHDGLATIRVDTTVLTPVDDPRLEARLLERIWDSTIKFDVETGRVVSRKTGIDRRVVGFGGPQSSVRYKSTLEERVR